MFGIITLTTDFGYKDEAVASMKGVILSINPQVRIVDISHGIPPFNIGEGAWVMMRSLKYFPPAIHVGVVDPGVGSSRRAIVIETANTSLLVGPDNGLLLPPANELGGIKRVYEIENPDLMLHPVSISFHGRDIFSPVAAHLSRGIKIGKVGPPIKVESLIPPPWSPPEIRENLIRGQIIHIDHFGNLYTNIPIEKVREVGSVFEITLGDRCEIAKLVKTFSSVSRGTLALKDDAYGYLEISVNLGSAKEMFSAETLQIFSLKPLH